MLKQTSSPMFQWALVVWCIKKINELFDFLNKKNKQSWGFGNVETPPNDVTTRRWWHWNTEILCFLFGIRGKDVVMLCASLFLLQISSQRSIGFNKSESADVLRQKNLDLFIKFKGFMFPSSMVIKTVWPMPHCSSSLLGSFPSIKVCWGFSLCFQT